MGLLFIRVIYLQTVALFSVRSIKRRRKKSTWWSVLLSVLRLLLFIISSLFSVAVIDDDNFKWVRMVGLFKWSNRYNTWSNSPATTILSITYIYVETEIIKILLHCYAIWIYPKTIYIDIYIPSNRAILRCGYLRFWSTENIYLLPLNRYPNWLQLHRETKLLGTIEIVGRSSSSW